MLSSGKYGWLLVCMLIVVIGLCHETQGDQKMKSFEWQTTSPESQGMSSSKLNAARDKLANRGTKSLLVIRNDKIVYEWYSPDHGQKKRHYSASLAKALVGGMSLILALDDGRLNVDDFASQYVPQWKDDPEKSKITIRHLATHSSGVEDAEQDNLPHNKLPGWKGAFWRQDPDPFTISRDQAPIVFPPGSKYAYSNPGIAMLSYAVTASLKNAPQPDILSLLQERVMKPIGVPGNEWSIGYGRGYEIDGLTLYGSWGGGAFTARAIARVGRLMLHKGNWEGEQLISQEWAEKAVEYAGTPIPDRPAGNPQPASGLSWWLNYDGVWPSVPKDAFGGAGAGNQMLLVIPSLDMIIVRNGATIGRESEGDGFWGGAEKYLFNPIIDSIVEHKASPVIAGIEWDSVDNIIRKATGKGRDGSDNWPMTWADDGNQYTAYGDGYGFDPIVPEKLGLGFARIVGDPTDFVGENIRSDAENKGSGRSGKKASGLLMVDGVLYMWARNADDNGNHCQLAWSNDYAKTWTWSNWKFEEFGYMTFINFGPNYAGIPEKHKDYVYMVSHDNPCAYEVADTFILARVDKDKITDCNAYEYFRELDANNNPVWTDDIDQRGAVFINPGLCRRSGISYNAGLKRYLWWQQICPDKADTRFEGGFAIYDAPEPWGPWTVAYITDKWDVGPGETASFPTKWMSADGKTCYLVSSGNDNFTVRKAVLDKK